MPNAAQRHADSAKGLLRRGPQTAIALAAGLKISQPTVSRALSVLGDELVRLGAARSIQYALRDASRADVQAGVHRVTTQGQVQTLGTLVPVHPQGFVILRAGGDDRYSDGLPWWLFDMRPQGYLGRAYNQRHGADLGLPERLSDWDDTHVLRALLRQGSDLPGNLLLGTAARDAFVNASPVEPVDLAGKPQAYAAWAAAAARGEWPGSSAAGEQPKFTVYAQLDSGSAAHVIVKFSASVASAVSERWRDLLLAEHVALTVLNDAGVAAARTTLLDHGPQRFLEVQRFDREGALGRRALHSLAALDAEFVGSGGRWPDTVRALVGQRIVEPQALHTTCLLWAFGTLIGNTDMHSGNLSFLSDDAGRPYQLAPAYDMVPMAFAPTAGGDLPERPLALNIGEQVPAQAWRQALPLARQVVQRLESTGEFSPRFAPCIAALQAHVAAAQERIERLG